MIDLTRNINKYFTPFHVWTVHLYLSKDEVLEMMSGEYVTLHDRKFEVPIAQLCDNLKNGFYDRSVKYELLEIKNN